MLLPFFVSEFESMAQPLVCLALSNRGFASLLVSPPQRSDKPEPCAMSVLRRTVQILAKAQNWGKEQGQTPCSGGFHLIFFDEQAPPAICACWGGGFFYYPMGCFLRPGATLRHTFFVSLVFSSRPRRALARLVYPTLPEPRRDPVPDIIRVHRQTSSACAFCLTARSSC